MDSDWKDFVFFLFIASVGIVGGCRCGITGTTRIMHAEAVKHGAAEWKVNPDGSTEFQWKEQE